MKDVTHPGWIKFKGLLFLGLGIVSATLVICEHPSWKIATLLALAVWSFCRFYYFAFYVIEHYVDSSYRFSGLVSFAVYLWSRRSRAGERDSKR